jgi:hypothetical protein
VVENADKMVLDEEQIIEGCKVRDIFYYLFNG